MRDRNRLRVRHSLAVFAVGMLLVATAGAGRTVWLVRAGTSPSAAPRSVSALQAGPDQPVVPAAGAPSGAGQPPSAPAAHIPTPRQEPCLHCHLTGENRNPITPSFRWALFGGLGLVFVLGMVRSAAVWRSRRPWVPFSWRAAQWLDARFGLAEPLRGALSKPVPGYARQWFYCLGGITFFLFVVQAITGTLLAFYYKPTPAEARASIEFIQNEVRFGAGIRFIHQLCSSGMIIVCVAHMIRVFVMGAYKAPRELTWVSGVALLILTLAFGFTGYLLPWDQRAYWATTVGSEIAGSMPIIGGPALLLLRVGWDVSHLTLSRFYAAHMLILPLATVAMLGAHFWMIRRVGVVRPL